jgi:tetratricopeptide (TPR) repeat protein
MSQAVRFVGFICGLAVVGTASSARSQSLFFSGGYDDYNPRSFLSTGSSVSPNVSLVGGALESGGGRYAWDARHGLLTDIPGGTSDSAEFAARGGPWSNGSPSPDRTLSRRISRGIHGKMMAAYFFALDGFDRQATDLTEQAERLVDGTSDDALDMSDLANLVSLMMHVQRPEAARRHVERWLRVAEAGWGASSLYSGMARLYLAYVMEGEGESAEALANAEKALSILRHQLQADHSMRASAKAMIDRLSGNTEPPGVRREKLERKYGTYAAETAAGVLSECRVVCREAGLAAMVARLEAYAQARALAVPVDDWSVIAEVYLCEAHMTADDPEGARRHLERAIDLCRVVAQYRVPHLLHLSSVLETAHGDDSAASSALEQAATLTAAQWGETSDEYEGLLQLSPLPAKPGARRRPAEAMSQELVNGCGWFTYLLPRDSNIDGNDYYSSGNAFLELRELRISNKAEYAYRHLGLRLVRVEAGEVVGHDGGLRVTEVRPQTPAAVQGLRQGDIGDIIVEMDRAPTVCTGAVTFVLNDLERPSPYKLTYLRDGEPSEVYVSRVRQTAAEAR